MDSCGRLLGSLALSRVGRVCSHLKVHSGLQDHHWALRWAPPQRTLLSLYFLLYSYFTRTLLVLYSCCSRTLRIRFLYVSHVLLVFYSYFIILDSSFTHTYSYFSHTFLILYSYFTHTLLGARPDPACGMPRRLACDEGRLWQVCVAYAYSVCVAYRGFIEAWYSMRSVCLAYA